jgi:hypothetical protein
MDQHRPRKKEGPGLLDPRAPRKTESHQLLRHRPTKDKSARSSHLRAKFDDPWLEERIPWLAAEVTRLDGGPIAKLYLKKSRDSYRQYRRFGSERQRYLSWRYLQQVAVQLVGRPAVSSDQPPSQEEAK